MSMLNGLRPGKDGKLPKLEEPKKAAPAEKNPDDGDQGGGISIAANGDGSYKTSGDGGEQDHPSLGHALMHIASHHAPESKHMHIESDGMGMKSHQASEGGGAEGPHDHANIEALKQHMDQFLSEEAGEKGDGYEEKHEGLKGFGG